MRLVTSARVRAVGILLLEVAGFALLVAQQVNGNAKLKSDLLKLVSKAKAL